MSKMSKKTKLFFLLFMIFCLKNVSAATVDTTTAKIYAIDPEYMQKTGPIPSTYPTSYKIPVSDNKNKPTFEIEYGKNYLSVDENGVVTSHTTNRYCKDYSCWHGSTSDEEYDKVYENFQLFGEGLIKVTVDNSIYKVKVNVDDYSIPYSQAYMDKYLEESINSTMTDKEKIEIITKFVAKYPYSATSTSYVGFILGKGGDCIASANTIVYMARKLGYKAHVRYAVTKSSGNNHHNAAIQIGNDIYEVEAGYSNPIGSNGYRPYHIWINKNGWSYYYADGYYQYDGYDEISEIPILVVSDKEQETKIASWALSKGLHQETKIKTIKVNKLINKIEPAAFNRATTLTEILVDEDNPYYTSVDGVVYTKDGKTLVSYPSGKTNETFTIPNTVEVIGSYAFSYNNNLKKLIFPNSVKTVEDHAFAYCKNLKDVSLNENLNTIGEYAFFDTDLNEITIPKNVEKIESNFVRNNRMNKEFVNVIVKGKNTVFDNIESIKSYINNLYCYKNSKVDEQAKENSLNIIYLDSNKIQITNSMVSSIPNSMTYNGNPTKVNNLTITDNGKKLVEGTDYKLTYSKISAGKYQDLVIEGINNYVGTLKYRYEVTWKDFELKVNKTTYELQEIRKGLSFDHNLETGDSLSIRYFKDTNENTINYYSNPNWIDKPGTYTIYYRIENIRPYLYNYDNSLKSITVTVYAEATSISIKPTSITLIPTFTEQLTATVSPEGAISKITWRSENPSIATVDQNGLVTAVKSGYTKIYAETDNKKSYYCWVSVQGETIYSLKLEKKSLTIEEKEKIKLKEIHEPESNRAFLIWESSNPSVATVDNEGNVTGIKEGKTIITVKSAACTNNDYYYCISDKAEITVLSKGQRIAYTTHVQTYGWQDYVRNGAMAGTSGEYKRLEAIKIKLENQKYTGNVLYRTHIQSYGWEKNFKKNDEMSGTSGEAKRLEAIEIKLDGEMKEHYDVYYRVHAQTFGWLGWARNGEQSGTAGYAKRLEGIEIKLVEKGQSVEGYGTIDAFKDANAPESITLNKTNISVEAGDTVQLIASILPETATDKTVTWISNKEDTATVDKNGKVTAKSEGVAVITATTINGKKAECTINVLPPIPGVAYKTHVQTYGWQDYVSNGAMSGTSGEAKRLEGINIKLKNQPYEGDILYRTHIQTYGWEKEFKKNDEMSGTSGEAKRLEAIEIKLTGEMAEHYDIYYRVHAQSFGWLGWAKNGEQSGTAGYAKRLEGIEIVLVEKGGTPPKRDNQNNENSFIENNE